MSEAIGIGDLVMVTRGMLCCSSTTPMQGSIFRVTGISTFSGFRCTYCGVAATQDHLASGGQLRIDVGRLKRIPPLGELDDVKRDEEISA